IMKLDPRPRGPLTVILLISCSFPPIAQSQVPNQVKYLEQGWSDSQRQKFYTLSQGSQLMPLSWFTALEKSDSEDLFTADSLSRFGYLPNPASPDHLPVGFTKD